MAYRLAAAAMVASLSFLPSGVSLAGDHIAAPGAFAQVAQRSAVVGMPFPAFNLTEVDGTALSNDLLRGKPAIVWFTASWCAPCFISAKRVAELDDALGGDAFRSLVVFIDLQETDEDLIAWRNENARDDWLVAFDSATEGLTQAAGVQLLDTKFLLDRDGVVRDVNTKIADEAYLERIRALVESAP